MELTNTGSMIMHPVSRKIVKSDNYTMFDDWKEVEFVQLIDCAEELHDNKAILKGIIEGTGEKFEIKMSIEDYFEGNFFTLVLEDNNKEQTHEEKKEILDSLETEKEYKLTTFSNRSFQEIEIVGNIKCQSANRVFIYHTRNGKVKSKVSQIHLSSLLHMSKWIKIEEIKQDIKIERGNDMLNNNLSNIKLNQKYTIVMDDSGILGSTMCKAVKCVIKDIIVKEYAQHKASIIFKIRRYRARQDELITVITESLAVVEGWIDFDTMIRYNVKESDIITTSELKANSPSVLKDNKNLVYWKDKGILETTTDANMIIELTGDYLTNRRFEDGVKDMTEAKDENYYKLIKDIVLNHNFSISDELKDSIREELGETALISDLDVIVKDFYTY